MVVYKIPYRRARAWPSASREQRYLAYNPKNTPKNFLFKVFSKFGNYVLSYCFPPATLPSSSSALQVPSSSPPKLFSSSPPIQPLPFSLAPLSSPPLQLQLTYPTAPTQAHLKMVYKHHNNTIRLTIQHKAALTTCVYR